VSLNLYYSFREGVKGLKRARIASTVTITTVALTLILLDLFLILTLNVQKIIRTFKSQMFLEVFIDNSLDSTMLNQLKISLSRVEGVLKVTYISPDQALERFRKEFGEDPQALLGENPLPSSFQIILSPSYRTSDQADAIAKTIGKLPHVDEVVYHGKFFKMVEKYSHIVLWIDFGLLVVVFASSLLLVSNTLRLTIFSHGRLIQIMQLIGATQGFIRRPYLIQGIFQGGLGGLICSIVVWGIIKIVSWRFLLHLESIPAFIWGPVLSGILLGWLGSLTALRRFLKTNA
jgi:cell division transport system permease protein